MSYSNRGGTNNLQPRNNQATARRQATRHGTSTPSIMSTRNEFDAVPMEYRAQVKHRCQRHFVEKKPKAPSRSWRSNIQQWHDEWLKAINKKAADRLDDDHCGDQDTLIEEVQIEWRLLANSGVDEGFIRPVINSFGFPLIPGSSIKGMFCNQWLKLGLPSDQLENLCGSRTNSKPLHQGLLRFHPVSVREDECLKKSLDITHSQAEWQLGTNHDRRKIEPRARGLISLWRPKLKIVISSQPNSITTEQWKIIRDVLIHSVAAGIGGRTAAGYGRASHSTVDKEKDVFSCQLRGQGIAPKLLDVSGSSEFRPVSLRAAIRGMAMRLFAGLIPAQLAAKQVERLFGGLNGPTVGLLACRFQELEPINIGIPVGPYESGFGYGRWEHHPPAMMNLKGTLVWELVRPSADRQELSSLIAALHGLVISLGGFSKGWRRVDHRLFPLYQDQTYYGKTPIGCHWDWIGLPDDQRWIQVHSRSGLEEFLEKARQSAVVWLQTQGITISTPPTECPTRWREVIHPRKMFVWARQAETHEDCIAIDWFHRDRIKSGKPDIRDVRFKGSSLAGQARYPSKVGHVWHRMLPLHLNSHDDYEPIAGAYAGQDKIVPEIWTGSFLEVVTFFAGLDDRDLEKAFLDLMNKASGGQGANFKPVRFA